MSTGRYRWYTAKRLAGMQKIEAIRLSVSILENDDNGLLDTRTVPKHIRHVQNRIYCAYLDITMPHSSRIRRYGQSCNHQILAVPLNAWSFLFKRGSIRTDFIEPIIMFAITSSTNPTTESTDRGSHMWLQQNSK